MLIIDNISDLHLIKYINPKEASGNILVTTTLQAFGNIVFPIELIEMSEEESVKFLLYRARIASDNKSISPEDIRVAQKIAVNFGGLPLAIDQVGAYIEELHVSLNDCISIYKEEPLELLGRRGDFALDHECVARTFLVTVEKIKHNAIAIDILQVLALLSENSIPLEIFYDGARYLGDHISPISSSKHKLAETLGLICRFSLIKRNSKTNTIEIHKLVQDVLKFSMGNELKLLWIERIIQSIASVFPFIDYKNWLSCQRLIPHATLLVFYIKSYNIESVAASDLLVKLGLYFYQQADYSQSENYLTKAMEIANKIVEPESVLIIESNLYLGMLYLKQNKFSEAITLFQQNLEVSQKTYGINHDLVLKNMHNLAVCYAEVHNFKEAEELLSKSMTIEKEIIEESSSIASTFHNLASIYYSVGEYKKAKEFFLKALSTSEKSFGKDSLEVAHVLNGLSALNISEADFDEAEKNCKQALNIRKTIYLYGHPDTATSLERLATIYIRCNRLDEAESLIIEALSLLKNFFGENHLDVAESLYCLADILRLKENYEEAKRNLLEALEIRVTLLPSNSTKLADSYLAVGQFFYNINSLDDAADYFTKAKEIYIQHFDLEHKRIITVDYNLAATKYKQGFVKEAIPLLITSFSKLASLQDFNVLATTSDFIHILIFFYENNEPIDLIPDWKSILCSIEKTLNPHHPDLETIYKHIGFCLFNKKQYIEATPYAEKALSINEQIYGKDSIKTFPNLFNLAKVYSEAGKVDEAEKMWQRLLLIQRNTYGSQHIETATTLFYIGLFYCHKKNYKVAETYLYRSLNIRKTLLGEKHFLVAEPLNALGLISYDISNYIKAKDFYTRSLEILEEPNNIDNTDSQPILLEVLTNLAQLYIAICLSTPKVIKLSNNIEVKNPDRKFNLEYISKAENFAKRAYNLMINLKNPEPLRLADVRENLASSYYIQKKNYSEASKLLEECLAIREKYLGLNNRPVALACANLALVYEKLGKLEEAKSMKAKSKSICDNLKIKPFN